jgi:hypothetical protein
MRLRHKTTTATITGTQWNEDHTLAAHALGDITGSVSLTLDNGSVQTGTLTGNVTFTLPTVTAGTTEHLTLILTNDSTAGSAVTITGIQWVGGTAPTFDTAAAAKNIIVLRGTNSNGWIGDGRNFA